MTLRAVLWDLDGTLVDSEPHWFAAEQTLAAEYGAVWTAEQALAQVGQPIRQTLANLVAAGIPLSIAEAERELMERMRRQIAADGVEFRPGVMELWNALAEQGMRQALVTMSYGPYMDAVIPWLPAFDHLQLGNSVQRGKPAPDIYLAAMDSLGVTPEQSLGIEDSVVGAGALLAAGVTPIGVPNLLELPEDPRLIVLDTLTGVTPDDLAAIHRDWQSRTRNGVR